MCAISTYNIVDCCSAADKKIILSIQNCFGTHLINIENLANVVRDKFIKLCSKKSFLETLYNKFY